MFELTGSTLAFILIISVMCLYMHTTYSARIDALGPTLLTTFGIFGCFVGIAVGLQDFDTTNVQGSVPDLISGIKTAFWSSVVGIGGALTLKLRSLLFGVPAAADGSQSNATVDDLANLLAQLKQSISGSDDSTLLSQAKLHRQDCNDRLDKLNNSFVKFAHEMAEANSKALIKALEEVIRDFNTKLNEQFGDNFRQLNQAVEKLVVWQNAYKVSLDHLIAQETATRNSMEEASARYAELVHKAGAFVDIAQRLESILGTLEGQRSKLDLGLKGLAGLVDTVAHGLPLVEKHILEVTRQLEAGARAHRDQIEATIKAITQNLQSSQTELRVMLSDAIKQTSQDLATSVKQASEDTRKQVAALDQGLEKTLTHSLETLGRQLAALSKQFVDDYTPLTQQLQRVVRMAAQQ